MEAAQVPERRSGGSRARSTDAPRGSTAAGYPTAWLSHCLVIPLFGYPTAWLSHCRAYHTGTLTFTIGRHLKVLTAALDTICSESLRHRTEPQVHLTFLISDTMPLDQAAGYITVAVLKT